ncbi:MAG TPA: lysophospholipid acyltransferase family protein, partial [Rhodospirillaceae bacterium]|nr:lysophospholipid acyltransferase family protein [Rhodospirillaceae bacterium]
GEIPAFFWEQNKPFILAFWHGRILMMPFCWRRERPINMLISQHRDGQIIARTVSHFGIDTIAGSSSRGGFSALRSMLKNLKAGRCVGITPDGPRGPRMTASEGIVQLAKISGTPIIPCTFSSRWRFVLGSWDRFILALPFSRGEIRWGQPITVPGDANPALLEELRATIEQQLNAITDETDRRMGHPPIARPSSPDRAEGVQE